MMDTEQMQAEFLRRYEDIVASGDTRQMERLGDMVKRVMRWLINEEMLAAVYQLALDRLKDRDGRFNIRKYFDLPTKQ